MAINHAYSCGVAINASEAKVPIRALRNLCHHTNFGGQLMLSPNYTYDKVAAPSLCCI